MTEVIAVFLKNYSCDHDCEDQQGLFETAQDALNFLKIYNPKPDWNDSEKIEEFNQGYYEVEMGKFYLIRRITVQKHIC